MNNQSAQTSNGSEDLVHKKESEPRKVQFLSPKIAESGHKYMPNNLSYVISKKNKEFLAFIKISLFLILFVVFVLMIYRIDKL